MNEQLLRQIPKVDVLLGAPGLAAVRETVAPQVITDAIRAELEALRQNILGGVLTVIPEESQLCDQIVQRIRTAALPSLRSVINGTGVALHTNLGRACLSDRAVAAVTETAQSYSTLEYDVSAGQRGHRYSHVTPLLTRLTGAEDALVVNNNAAAVLLILSVLAAGGDVIVSRGELVEIGGSFRIPEIMEACGCRLREVGTTNKTHPIDYERAVSPETRALLKVHTSNYRIVGFTDAVSRSELVEIGRRHGLPVIEDLGSGCLVDLARFGLQQEPTVQQSVQAGVDVISFSGDKLLGGPQAGIIVGKRTYVQPLKTHPLARAMRVDKMTLAALEATLRAYAEGTAVSELPTLAMLTADSDQLHARAVLLADLAVQAGVRADVVPCTAQAGGGSLPAQDLPGYAVSIRPRTGSLDALETALRRRPRPIVGRIAHDQYLLDVRTLQESDFACIVQALTECAL